MFVTRKNNQIYDSWLIWNPAYKCNLRCEYCLAPSRERVESSRINIPVLLRTLKNTNKTFRISFTGGEPFLVPNIIDACIEITKHHFISINTNLTTSKILEFSEKVDPDRVLFIIASLHIKELERLNLVDKYVHNFQICKDRGFTIIPSVVVYPPLVDEIAKYKDLFQKKGIDLNFDLFMGLYAGKIYPDSYSNEVLAILGRDVEDTRIFKQKGQLCNAGYNAAIVEPDGNIRPCPNIGKSIGSIYDKVSFKEKLICCPFQTCGCPLNIYDPYLFEKAKRLTNLATISPLFLTKDLIRNNIRKVATKSLPRDIYKRIKVIIKHNRP